MASARNSPGLLCRTFLRFQLVREATQVRHRVPDPDARKKRDVLRPRINVAPAFRQSRPLRTSQRAINGSRRSFRHRLGWESLRRRDGKRDPEMHQTKTGERWYFRLKAHIGGDAEQGHVHSVATNAASVADCHMQTKQSNMRFDEMEAAPACPELPGTDPQAIQRKSTGNEARACRD
jgi:hypothetical protein